MTTDGYTQVPHDILETVAGGHLSGAEHAVFDVIVRQTIGYKRSCHNLALSFIAKAADLHKNIVWRALQNLIAAGIVGCVSRASSRLPATYGLAPVNQWRVPIRPHKERETVTSKGDSPQETITARGDSYVPVSNEGCMGGDSVVTAEGYKVSPSEVTDYNLPSDQRKILKDKRKEKEKSAPLKSPPEGDIVDSMKRFESTRHLSNQNDFSEGASPQKQKPESQKANVDDCLQFLADVFRDIHGEANVLLLLDGEQKRIASGLMDKPRSRQTQILSEFASAAKRAKENGSYLPPHLAGPNLFLYLLKNRTSV